MLHLYEQKTVSRDQLVWEVRQAMRELVQQMKSRICDHPEAERLMENKADDEDGIVEEGLRLYRFP